LSRVLYRFVHAVNASYALAVAWIYIGAFALALSLLFIFPQVTLLMFFVGLATLGLAVMLSWAIDIATRGLARRALSSGRCPRCSSGGQSPKQADRAWTCEHCRAEFTVECGQIDARDRERIITADAD
jgi:hypothetical protein